MWHSQVQQTRPGIQGSGAKFGPETNNWEELLDSGYLDRQLGQMNFNAASSQATAQRVPASAAARQPVPLMSVITTPPPNLLNQGYANGNGCSNGILGRHPPPPQMIAQPRPRFQRVPPPANFVRQPQRLNGAGGPMPIIDTSVPPPRLPHIQQRPALMQRPPPPSTNSSTTSSSSSNAFKGPLTDTDLSPPFPTAPVVKIVGDDEHRTQYAAPGPKVKILKRPSSTPSNLSSQANESGSEGKSDVNGGITKSASTTKSLKQREEEYAQARLRILGSTGTETGSDAK